MYSVQRNMCAANLHIVGREISNVFRVLLITNCVLLSTYCALRSNVFRVLRFMYFVL